MAEGGSNPLVEAAEQIGQRPSGDAAPAAKDNKVGSYEAFMHSFGSPRRWAGANS